MEAKVAQEPFLDLLIENKTFVCVYLVSGIRLQGIIENYDKYTLFLDGKTGKQAVFKRVISTIAVQ